MRSIKWRFILPFLVIIIAATTALTIYLTTTYTKAYFDDAQTVLTSEAELLTAEIMRLPEDQVTNQRLQEIAERYSDNLSARVTLIAMDGTVIAESEVNPETMVNHLNRPEVQQVIEGESGFNIRYSTTLKTQLMYVAVGLQRDGQLLCIVRLAKPLSALEPRVREIRQTLLLGGLAAIFAGFAFTFAAANLTIAPITKLTRSAKAISEGDFSQIPEIGPDNEVNDLTRAFSHMAEQIKGQLSTINTQKERLERLVDRLIDGIIIVNRDGKINLINQTAKSMFTIENEVNPSDDFIKAMQNYQLVELWQKTLLSGEDESAEIENLGQSKYYLGLTTYLGAKEERTVLILIQDQTKPRQLEEMRQTFVGNVSHELRTPLASMKALAETLQECISTDPENAKRFLELMDIEIDKLTQMVMELLELSRIESGRVEMRKTRVNVIDLLRPPVERMCHQAERSKIVLKVMDPGSLPTIHADPERVEQVLINLIHNAIKHTPPGGTITISAEIRGKDVLIKVADTGEGISEKDLPRIFERFYKTDKARASGGTGLGLSIAKHIIEAHHGKIWVESTPGKGATFFITLPTE